MVLATEFTLGAVVFQNIHCRSSDLANRWISPQKSQNSCTRILQAPLAVEINLLLKVKLSTGHSANLGHER